MTKIYVKGNYLIIDKPDGSRLRRLRQNVEVQLTVQDGSSYTFYDDHVQYFQIAFAEIKDENGDAFASQEVFESFVNSNTGVTPTSNAGGGPTPSFRNFRRTEDDDSDPGTAQSESFTCNALVIRFVGTGGKFQNQDVEDGEVISGGGDLRLPSIIDYNRPPGGKVVFTEIIEL